MSLKSLDFGQRHGCIRKYKKPRALKKGLCVNRPFFCGKIESWFAHDSFGIISSGWFVMLNDFVEYIVVKV